MIARDAGGFPIEQEAYDATLRSLDRIIRENEQFRKALQMIQKGQIPQAMSPALFAEFVLRGPVEQQEPKP